jgi:hypothetical protein
VERKYTEDPSKLREIMAGFFAVFYAMANHAEEKFPAWYAENQS